MLHCTGYSRDAIRYLYLCAEISAIAENAIAVEYSDVSHLRAPKIISSLLRNSLACKSLT